MRLRGFVPLDELQRDEQAAADQEEPGVPRFIGEPIESWDVRTSLFGDAE
jgi:hypothetical protein